MQNLNHINLQLMDERRRWSTDTLGHTSRDSSSSLFLLLRSLISLDCTLHPAPQLPELKLLSTRPQRYHIQFRVSSNLTFFILPINPFESESGI